ncbi:MAG: RluA family pseudouridine synthase [Blautia sp.]|jgi:23S rRNA pseudouridine1911/1915/1917 synthase
MGRKLFYPVTAEEDGKTAAFIMQHRMHMTKKEIRRAKFLEMGISTEGRQIRSTAVLHEGDLLEIALERNRPSVPEMPEEPKTWQGLPVSILYEDVDVLVVNKPSGMAVHPVATHQEQTLAQWTAHYLRKQRLDCTPRSIGRLDVETSGALLFAKNRLSAARLWRQQENNQLTKTYLALSEGHLDQPADTVCLPIKKADPHSRQRMIPSPDGQTAITHYQVLAQLSCCDLIKLSLDTGRTHQIRVHMAALGHPLAGDRIYGKKALPFPARAALHVWKLEFLQPFTGTPLCVHAPIPGDFCQKLKEEGMTYEAFNALLH